MASTAEPATDREVSDRLRILWHVMFAATLLVPTGLAVTDTDLAGSDRLIAALVAVAFGVLHWLVLARHPQWWEHRLGVMAGYWVVACGLTMVLAAIHGSYTIVLYGLYPLMFQTLSWWGIVPIVGLTGMVSWALGGPASAAVTNLFVNAGLALVIAVFITAVARQSEERRDALKALAVTRAELAETARHAGVLAERERLARELHDTVAQGFISVVTQLESAEQALDSRPADAREHLHKAGRTARDSLGELRRSVKALRPDLLESASLVQALERTVQGWSAQAALPAELRTTGSPVALPPDTDLALLRATQEALANVGRHAAASRVIVSLSFLGDTVTLDVDDDGTGFDVEPRPRADGGYGLIGMRERIEAAGGELIIESAPGQGTTIAVSVPAGVTR